MLIVRDGGEPLPLLSHGAKGLALIDGQREPPSIQAGAFIALPLEDIQVLAEKSLIRSMKRTTRNIQPPRMFGGMDRGAKFSCHRALALARGRAIRLS